MVASTRIRLQISICMVVPVFSLLVMVGWFLRVDGLVQIRDGFAPMQFNTALLFLCSAGALWLGMGRKRRSSVGVSSLLLVFAVVTTVQYPLGVNLGLDELFVTAYLQDSTSHPGRMAPNTGICFSLLALAILFSFGGRSLWPVSVFLVSLILGISVIALYGYAAKVENAYGWGNFTSMALHTATGFLLLSAALLSELWRKTRRIAEDKKIPEWLPIPVGILVFATAVCAWNTLEIQEEKQSRREASLLASVLAEKAGLALAGDIKALERMRDRFDGGMRGSGWIADAENYAADLPGLMAVAIVTEDGDFWRVVTDVEPAVDVRQLQMGPHLPPDRSEEVRIVTLVEGEIQQFVVVLPITEPLQNGKGGWLLAFYRASEFFVAAFGQNGARRSVRVWYESDQDLWSFAPAFPDPSLSERAEIADFDTDWEVAVRPESAAAMTEAGYPLSALVLAAGLIFAVLIAALVATALNGYHARMLRTDAEMRQAHDQLETMLYIVSHDLREPIRSIVSFTGILDRTERENLSEKGTDLLSRVRRAGERMDNLLTEVVRVSRLDRSELPRERVELDSVVTEVLDALENVIDQKKAEITRKEAMPVVSGDPTWIRHAIENLVSNALKFSKEGEVPRITIAPFRGEEGVGVSVADNGIGLPENADDRLFDLFRRGVGRKVEGAGVGLAIVKRVARKHGGEAWFRARYEEGSEFFVTFGEEGA